MKLIKNFHVPVLTCKLYWQVVLKTEINLLKSNITEVLNNVCLCKILNKVCVILVNEI